jgi:hypothetical protein
VDRIVERDGCAAFVDGVALEISKLLSRRVEHVKKHRAKMLDDAHKDVTAARAKYSVAIRGLLGLRAELIEAREVLLWAAVFPDLVEPFGASNNVGLGLASVTRDTLGTNAQLEFGTLLALLERDGEVLAKVAGPQAKKALGTAGPRVPTAEAMWDDEPDMVEWKKVEKERARMLYERDFRDPHLLGEEIRD